MDFGGESFRDMMLGETENFTGDSSLGNRLKDESVLQKPAGCKVIILLIDCTYHFMDDVLVFQCYGEMES